VWRDFAVVQVLMIGILALVLAALVGAFVGLVYVTGAEV
jgi:hypothetical protein